MTYRPTAAGSTEVLIAKAALKTGEAAPDRSRSTFCR